MNTNIKRWSVGSPIQAPLDSLLELIRAHGLTADQVERAVIRVSHTGATTTDNRAMPDICMQQMCAVMLMDGIVTFESAHDEPRMRHRPTMQVRQRIELFGDDDLQARLPGREGIVELKLRDGRELHTTRGPCEAPRKTPWPGRRWTRSAITSWRIDSAHDVAGNSAMRYGTSRKSETCANCDRSYRASCEFCTGLSARPGDLRIDALRRCVVAQHLARVDELDNVRPLDHASKQVPIYDGDLIQAAGGHQLEHV